MPVYYVISRYLYPGPGMRARRPGHAGSWAQVCGLMGPGMQDEIKIAPFSTN